MDRFIICEVGSGDVPEYRVFERTNDWTLSYYTPTKILHNPPTTLRVARNMLERLQYEFDREASCEGGLRS